MNFLRSKWELIKSLLFPKTCDTCDNAGQETISKVASCNLCENYDYYMSRKDDEND